jgi:GNAT superfamily N-acetyltransferase
MTAPGLKIRRGRRQDFAAVMRLLALDEVAPDRRTLRRFRSIVADLGADLYVADLGGRVVGVIHATYARRLGGAQGARVEDLAADTDYRQHQIARRLFEFILERARKRSCATLCCVPAEDEAGALARELGLLPHETEYRRALAGEV